MIPVAVVAVVAPAALVDQGDRLPDQDRGHPGSMTREKPSMDQA
jgi:hypothetical protein